MRIEGSSNIMEVDYNSITKVMTVTFTGGAKYTVEPVTPTVHTNFMNAKSKGNFYTTEFKMKPGKYRIIKLALGSGSTAIPTVKKSDSIEVPIHQLSRDFHKIKN